MCSASLASGRLSARRRKSLSVMDFVLYPAGRLLPAGWQEAHLSMRVSSGLHFFQGHVPDVRSNPPLEPEGIFDTGHAVAIGLVGWSTQAYCSSFKGLFVDGVAVLHIEHDAHGGSSEMLWAVELLIGGFIGQHDAGVANLNLSVLQAAIRSRHAHALFCAERFLVELNGFGRASNMQVRLNTVVSVWNGFYCGHSFFLLYAVHFYAGAKKRDCKKLTSCTVFSAR